MESLDLMPGLWATIAICGFAFVGVIALLIAAALEGKAAANA